MQINTRIVASFHSALAATEDAARARAIEKLQGEMSELVQAADEKASPHHKFATETRTTLIGGQYSAAQGPYFLGHQMCLVDVHLAPFALRLSRLPQVFRGWKSPSPEPRWRQWLDAIEQNPHVRRTTSAAALYSKSMQDLLRGVQRVSG